MSYRRTVLVPVPENVPVLHSLLYLRLKFSSACKCNCWSGAIGLSCWDIHFHFTYFFFFFLLMKMISMENIFLGKWHVFLCLVVTLKLSPRTFPLFGSHGKSLMFYIISYNYRKTLVANILLWIILNSEEKDAFAEKNCKIILFYY